MEPPTKFVLESSLVERRTPLRACAEQSRRVQAERSSPAGCRHRKRRIAITLAVFLCAMIISSPDALFAQTPPAIPAPAPTASPTPASSAEPDGVTRGGYQIHSSVEFGYRSNDVTGSEDMYDTLVNLQTGPRILDQTLTMQSVDHQGLLFDNLYLNSVGWGGDPNNYMRLRADKDKWYNLQGSFRRDQSFFDYDLLANPLNPLTSTPSIPILNSPHAFPTRRMTDVDLTLLPQSVLQLLAEPADPHCHAHRAHQPAQQLLPEIRGARFLFVQFRDLQHTVGRVFRRPDHAQQHPRLYRRWDNCCKPYF
jgi:hypothetical protein